MGFIGEVLSLHVMLFASHGKSSTEIKSKNVEQKKIESNFTDSKLFLVGRQVQQTLQEL